MVDNARIQVDNARFQVDNAKIQVDKSRSDQLLTVFFPQLAPLNSHKVIFALLLCPDCSFRFETLLINQLAPGGSHLIDQGKIIDDLLIII